MHVELCTDVYVERYFKADNTILVWCSLQKARVYNIIYVYIYIATFTYVSVLLLKHLWCRPIGEPYYINIGGGGGFMHVSQRLATSIVEQPES